MTNNEGRLNIEIQSQRNEIIRLREDNERLDKELDVLHEITDDFDEKLYAALQWKKQARELLEELAKYFRQGKWLYDMFPSVEDTHNEYARKIRTFLDGEDDVHTT